MKNVLKKEFGSVMWESKKLLVSQALERALISERRSSAQSMNSMELLAQIIHGWGDEDDDATQELVGAMTGGVASSGPAASSS